MPQVTYDCIDAGTENCPCALALTGDCLMCTKLGGCGDCDCDCRWRGVCVYNEMMQNGGRVSRPREDREVTVERRVSYGGGITVFVLKIEAGFALEAGKPGTYVFLRAKESPAFSAVPVSVLLADPERGEIHLAVKAAGPKTKALVQAEGSLLMRGIYRNGIQGLRNLEKYGKRSMTPVWNGVSRRVEAPMSTGAMDTGQNPAAKKPERGTSDVGPQDVLGHGLRRSGQITRPAEIEYEALATGQDSMLATGQDSMLATGQDSMRAVEPCQRKPEAAVFIRGMGIISLNNILRSCPTLGEAEIFFDPNGLPTEFISDYFTDRRLLHWESGEKNLAGREAEATPLSAVAGTESQGEPTLYLPMAPEELAVLLMSDHFLKKVQSRLRKMSPGVRFVWSNNAKCCCGEGLCGACTEQNGKESVVRMCKCQRCDNAVL